MENNTNRCRISLSGDEMFGDRTVVAFTPYLGCAECH